jgi:hypothetical protein
MDKCVHSWRGEAAVGYQCGAIIFSAVVTVLFFRVMRRWGFSQSDRYHLSPIRYAWEL